MAKIRFGSEELEEIEEYDPDWSDHAYQVIKVVEDTYGSHTGKKGIYSKRYHIEESFVPFGKNEIGLQIRVGLNEPVYNVIVRSPDKKLEQALVYDIKTIHLAVLWVARFLAALELTTHDFSEGDENK